MMRLTVSLVLALSAALLAGCGNGPATLAAPEQRLALAEVRLDPQAARELINLYRARKGLKPLALNPQLAEAAKRHSTDLARYDRIAHKGSDGSDPWSRVRKAGYRPRLAAENVGAGQRSLKEVVEGWKHSPGHDRHLLLPGIALVTDAGTRYGTFWTLVLGSPL